LQDSSILRNVNRKESKFLVKAGGGDRKKLKIQPGSGRWVQRWSAGGNGVHEHKNQEKGKKKSNCKKEEGGV